MKLCCLALILVAGAGCGDLEVWVTPEEMLEDPALAGAIAASGFTYTLGDSPPNIEGFYKVNGTTTASSDPNQLGVQIDSFYCYLGQDGRHIESVETSSGYSSWGPGLFITGTSNTFTVWKDAYPKGSCSAHTNVLLTGQLRANGFDAESLTVVLDGNCGVPPGTWAVRMSTFDFLQPCVLDP